MKRPLAYSALVLTVQAAVICLAIVLSSVVKSELPAVVIIYAYFPTILLIEKIGHFVGCSNMIGPLFLGIPLGIFVYSVAAGLIVSRIKYIRAAKMSALATQAD